MKAYELRQGIEDCSEARVGNRGSTIRLTEATSDMRIMISSGDIGCQLTAQSQDLPFMLSWWAAPIKYSRAKMTKTP